jgi:hypothetical protein
MTQCAIGEIRNGNVKAVRAFWDGDPGSVIDALQWRIPEQGGIVPFLEWLYQSSEWINLNKGPEKGAASGPLYTSLDAIRESWVEYAYLFNFDNRGFYILSHARTPLLVLGGCKFEMIHEIDFEYPENKDGLEVFDL